MSNVFGVEGLMQIPLPLCSQTGFTTCKWTN